MHSILDQEPRSRSIGIIGTQPEALLLSVLFAESNVPNYLVGTFERLTMKQSTRNPLEEARWLLGIHADNGTIRLLDSAEDLPFPDIGGIVLTAHSIDLQASPFWEKTIRAISRNIVKGSNFIYTGLSRPGQTASIAETIQRYGGLKVGADIGLCYLPLLWNGENLKTFRETPRIIAGTGRDAIVDAQELFLKIFPSLSSTQRIKAGEAAGLFAPIYREVVGALELELARLCVGEGVDYSDALSLCRGLGLSSLGSPRLMPSRDSVGSEIALSLTPTGSGAGLIRAARRANEESDQRIVALVKNALARCGHRLRHSKIAVLGLDGLGVNSMLRPQPLGLLQTLKRRGATISIYPGTGMSWVNNETFGGNIRVERNIARAVEKAHCALVALDRPENGELNPQKLASEMSRPAAICDLTGVLEASNVERAGLLYTSIGRGSPEA